MEKNEIKRSETIELVMFEYEDDDVSFNIALEFIYTHTKEYNDSEMLKIFSTPLEKDFLELPNFDDKK